MTITAEQVARAALDQFLDRYTDHPRLFVREAFDMPADWIGPEQWQDEVLEQYEKRTRRISIRSGHGVGKTTTLAWIAIHHMLCRFPQKTVITAPTSSQLWDALWPELQTWIGRLRPKMRELFEIKQDRIEHHEAPKESFISARTSRAEQPDALQGVHAPWVLLIGDEGSGIPEQVYEAAAGSMSGANAITILAGNPVRGQGFFFDTHGKLAGDGQNGTWWTRKVSCFESRFVDPDFPKDIAARYGEHSNAYRVRVLGEFPVSDDDTVIPFDVVEAATTRDVQPSPLQPIWGVDCARFGSDRSALAKRQGNVLMEPPRFWHKLDTMDVAARIKTEWDNTPSEQKPASINIDVIGIGAGVVDRLRELGLPCRGINVSETGALKAPEVYRNLRAELWFSMREWFTRRDCRIPKPSRREDAVEMLIRELTLPTYKYTPQSRKIFVESKEELKKRGQPSPDLAEAFLLTFATESITLASGHYGSTNWKVPLPHKIKGLV